MRRKRKVAFLSNKYGRWDENRNEGTAEIEGIILEDQTVPSSFSSSPRCYGAVELAENEVSLTVELQENNTHARTVENFYQL